MFELQCWPYVFLGNLSLPRSELEGRYSHLEMLNRPKQCEAAIIPGVVSMYVIVKGICLCLALSSGRTTMFIYNLALAAAAASQVSGAPHVKMFGRP